MKNSWLLKFSILATVLATLTGCPALSNLMELLAREQTKPKKMLTITGIPPEYEGSSMMITATDSTDTLGERLCLSGGDPSGRIVKDNVGKTLILEMNAKKMDTKISALVTLGKNLTGTAKSCDSTERIIALSFIGKHLENLDDSTLVEEVFNSTFIYTKGINICNASADVLSKTKLTLSFSKIDTTLKFSDFMRASDCEILMDIVRSVQNESEEYVVVNENGLDVMKEHNLNSEKIGKIAHGEIINVILPKETKKIDTLLWTKVYYKDKDGSKKIGWVIEQTLPKTTESKTESKAMYNNAKFTVAHGMFSRTPNKFKTYYKNGKATQRIFDTFTQATSMMPSLGTSNKYEMGLEQILPDVTQDVILPARPFNSKSSFMIAQRDTKSPATQSAVENSTASCVVYQGPVLNMIPKDFKDYIVIKPLDLINPTSSVPIYGSNAKPIQYQPGDIIKVSKYSGKLHSEGCFYVYENDKVIGRVNLEKYKNVSMNAVMAPIKEWMTDYKWEQYFVTTNSGLENINVRKEPNIDSKLAHSEGDGLKPGEVILIASEAKDENYSKPDEDGISWVIVYYGDNSSRRWVAIEKYINKNSSVKEWINIFSTSKKKQLDFMKNLDTKFIKNVEGGQQTEGYLVGNEKDGIVSSIVEESGLTIATGFDIGKRNESNIDRIFGIWTKEENPETYTLINLYKSSPYLGSRLDLVSKVESDLKLMYLWNNEKKRLKISKEQAILTDHAAMFIHLIDIMSKYNTFTKGNFDELPTEAQTVLFSLSYQYGVFSQKYDNIMQKISEKDYHAAAASIQGLDPDGKNYGDRRLKEANLLIQMK